MQGFNAASAARPGPTARRAYRSERDVGEPIRVGGVTLTPVARVRGLRFGSWGVATRYPSEVIVERGGSVERLAIPDVTLIALAALIGAALLFRVLTGLVWLTNGRERDGQPNGQGVEGAGDP